MTRRDVLVEFLSGGAGRARRNSGPGLSVGPDKTGSKS